MKIQQTENYTLFKRIQGNRTINKAQVKKLFDSLGNHPELATAIPIIVNDNMEVIDGQHRLEALRKLELPVSYLQLGDLQLKDVQIINSATKVWTPVDYARSYSELGNKNYDIYLAFKKKYGLVHNILLSYLANADFIGGGKTTVQGFREGKFQVINEGKAHELCQKLLGIQQFYARGDSRVFALAFKKIATHPEYDHSRMIEKIRAYSKFFKDSPYAEDYMRQLEKIYNFHSSTNRVKLF